MQTLSLYENSNKGDIPPQAQVVDDQGLNGMAKISKGL